MTTIPPHQRSDRLQKGEQLQLLDVRTPEEYARMPWNQRGEAAHVGRA